MSRNEAPGIHSDYSSINNASLVDKISGRIFDSKISILAFREMQSIIISRKFFILIFAFFLPPFTELLFNPATSSKTPSDVRETFELFIGNYIVNLFTIFSLETVPYGTIAGLTIQILLVLIASEFLAQEFEEKTISMLLVTPTKKTDIVLGKLVGFLVVFCTLSAIIVFGYAGLLTIQMIGSFDQFLELMGPAIICFGILTLGFLSYACLMLLLSTYFNKSLYAALTGILVLFGLEIFVPSLVGTEYRFSYQLGVILEEFIVISNSNLYSGYYLVSIPALLVIDAIFLTLAMILFFRREFP